MWKRVLFVVPWLWIAIEYTGGIGQLSRELPTALCWTLAPSYGNPSGGCSHNKEEMLRLSR